MRKLCLLTIVTAGLPLLAACTQSVERAQRDVHNERQEAAQEIAREQRELRDEQGASAERIARQQQRVQDEVREGQREITQEQRDLEDAKRAEARRNDGFNRENDITPVTPAPLP